MVRDAVVVSILYSFLAMNFPGVRRMEFFSVNSEKMVLETKPEMKFSGAPQTGILRISKTTGFFS